MKIAKALSVLGLLAMTGILIYAFTSGNFGAEGAKLLALQTSRGDWKRFWYGKRT